MSTIPAVIAALVALGEATLSSTDWQVLDGPVPRLKDRVFVVADEDIVSPPDFSLGAEVVADHYTVPLAVSVALPGADTLPTARTLALEAYEDICEAIRASPGQNLGLGAQGVLKVAPTTERRVQQFATANGRSVTVRFNADTFAQTI